MSSVIVDLFIVIGTITSYYLITHNDRQGFFVGLCVQPFWIWEAGHSHSYGVLCVSVFFLYCQVEGILRTRPAKNILSVQKIKR